VRSSVGKVGHFSVGIRAVSKWGEGPDLMVQRETRSLSASKGGKGLRIDVSRRIEGEKTAYLWCSWIN